MGSCITREHSCDAVPSNVSAYEWPMSENEQDVRVEWLQQHILQTNSQANGVTTKPPQLRRSVHWAQLLVEVVYEVPAEDRRGEWLPAGDLEFLESDEFMMVLQNMSSETSAGTNVIVEELLETGSGLSEVWPQPDDACDEAVIEKGSKTTLLAYPASAQSLGSAGGEEAQLHAMRADAGQPCTEHIARQSGTVAVATIHGDVEPVRVFSHRRTRTARVRPAHQVSTGCALSGP